MKVLIIADFSSVYMYEYVKEVISSENFDEGKEFYFFHSGQAIANEKYKELYSTVSKKMFFETPYRWKNYALIDAIREIGTIDVLHVHYIKLGFYGAIKKHRKYIKKIILTSWGSDFLRLPSRYRPLMKRFLDIADILAVDSENLRDYALSLDSNYLDKMVIMKFGTPVVDELEKIKGKYDTSELREKFGIPQSSWVVACGYNGNVAQQHDKIVSALNSMEDIYKKQIFLYIHMGYAFDEEYCERLTNLLNLSHISYTIDKNFYDAKEMAKIRMLADIFIHGQTTDANSSSLFEYLYADTIVINGKWLPYKDVKKYQIPIFEFSEFSELSKIVPYVMDNYDVEIAKLKEKNKKLLEARSWKKLKKKWQELY